MVGRFLPEGIKAALRAERQRWRGAWEVSGNVAAFAPRVLTAARLRRPRRRVLCYPGRPSKYQALYKVCALNGYHIVTRPQEPHDLAFHFTEGGTCELPENIPVINRRCTDISKSHVAATFERVFGYALAIDPTTYAGAMVEKSDGNYTHDGRIIRGPIAASAVVPGCVYQRLIGNVEGEEAVDLRTPVYAGRVPLVYVKYRPLATRFANANARVELREPQEVYSPEELEQLARFADAMGVDFGELDVLRDRAGAGDGAGAGAGGRIYVVDVAGTPAGPPNGLPDAPARIAIRRLAREFRRLIHDLISSPREP